MQRPIAVQWRRVVTPIALAVVSLLAAIILWVAVTDAQNPNRIDVFSGGIEVHAENVGDGLAVASIRQPIVSVRVSASEETFRRLTTADFRAWVDMAGVRDTTSEQFVRVEVLNERAAEVVEVTPRLVTVTLEPTATKLVPVTANLVGTPPQGFNVPLANIEPNPTSVRVTGAASLIQLVASAAADINLTGLRTSLTQQYALTARDARGADIRGVSLDTAIADVKVNVIQQEVTLPLTIVPAVQGSVAEGYNLVALTADPPAVPVSGPLAVLQATPFLRTEPIDVSGLRTDLSRNVRLVLPAGLQATRDTVSVRLHVVPAQGEISVTVVPTITGIPGDLKATLQTASLNVRLTGDLPLLRQLSAGAVRATVSAAGLDDGVFVLRPIITAPEGVQVASFDPTQVVFTLRR